jgi:hypothetical protein
MNELQQKLKFAYIGIIRDLLILLCLFLAILILFKKCPSDSETPITKHYRDTVFFEKQFTEIPVIINKPYKVEASYITDTVFKIDSIRYYTDTLKDSMIEIYYVDIVRGVLLDKKMSYKPLYPKYIKDSVVINTEIKKRYFFAGAEFGTSTKINSASVILGYADKKRRNYHYRYDFLFKTHSLGITLPIYLKTTSKEGNSR